jgi:catechol 2,3-dioxygenase-like lactoylglutathione lyase family enzyme
MPTPQAPFQIQRLDHLVLRTADLPRLVDFYVKLGCRIERDRTAEMGMVQLRLGVSMLDIVDVNFGGARAGNHPSAEVERNLDHFAARIEPFDRDAILEFCSAHGIEATPMAQPIFGADGMGPAVYLKDPDGNRVELKGPPIGD